MLTVMGTTSEPNFLKFQDYCCRAYNILRQNAALLTTLFILVTTEFGNSRQQQQQHSPHTTHDRCDHAVYRFGCEQMKPAGMPELSDLSDIQYMRERLNLHVSSSSAVVSHLVCGVLSLTLQHPFHRSRFPHTDDRGAGGGCVPHRDCKLAEHTVATHRQLHAPPQTWQELKWRRS